MLIAVAGADGVGKTTTARALVQALDREGVTAVVLDRFAILDRRRCPAASFVAADVRELRGHVLDMPSTSRLLFLLWSMALTVGDLAPGTGPDGAVVVYDSYWMKHTAAEIVYGVDETAALAVAGLLPRADLTVYLRLPPGQALERKAGDLVPYECGLDAACTPESFLRHQERIRTLLDAWARREGWHALEARRPVKANVDELLTRLRPLLLRTAAGADAADAVHSEPAP